MSDYFFHVHTDVECRDEEGTAFESLAEAKAFAVTNAQFLAVEELRRDHRFSPNHSIRIHDAQGMLLHSVRFGDTVDVRL